MLDIISANPYRVLGLYSNSPKKELVANLSKLNAFLKVGKPISFPTDMPSLLPDIERNNEMVADANSKLALPADQFRYAQFWFVKATDFDEIALNNLIAGDIDKALSIWEKREDASSLQDRIVCNLISNDISEAISCAEKLYTSYKNDFVKEILGDNPPIDTKNVEYEFLDRLCEGMGVDKVLAYVSNEDWKQHISSQAVKPLVDGLLNAVSVAQASEGKGSEERYKAGKKLMRGTKKPLAELMSLLTKSDTQYQMVADKIGLEILQCGISYYNGTKTYDAPRNAMELMTYALSIVVGQMAKERCEENVSIVQKAIDNRPSEIVVKEVEAIEQELRNFYSFLDNVQWEIGNISSLRQRIVLPLPRRESSPERSSRTWMNYLMPEIVELLNKTKRPLQSMKSKLGRYDSHYLKWSTIVVQNALSNIIERVNSDIRSMEEDRGFFPYGSYSDDRYLEQFRETSNMLKEAWSAILIMDTFDVESTLEKRYTENRSALKKICGQFGVSTLTPEERRIEEENRRKQVEHDRKARIRGAIIMAIFEIVALILTLTVGPGFIALMVLGGIVVFCIFINPHI